MLLLWLAWSPSVVCWAFFDRVEPGGVGRQRDELDGQLQLAPLPYRRCGWLIRPTGRAREVPAGHLRLQRHQHVGVEMHRPVVEYHIDAFGRSIGRALVLEETHQRGGRHPAAL